MSNFKNRTQSINLRPRDLNATAESSQNPNMTLKSFYEEDSIIHSGHSRPKSYVKERNTSLRTLIEPESSPKKTPPTTYNYNNPNKHVHIISDIFTVEDKAETKSVTQYSNKENLRQKTPTGQRTMGSRKAAKYLTKNIPSWKNSLSK